MLPFLPLPQQRPVRARPAGRQAGRPAGRPPRRPSRPRLFPPPEVTKGRHRRGARKWRKKRRAGPARPPLPARWGCRGGGAAPGGGRSSARAGGGAAGRGGGSGRDPAPGGAGGAGAGLAAAAAAAGPSPLPGCFATGGGGRAGGGGAHLCAGRNRPPFGVGAAVRAAPFSSESGESKASLLVPGLMLLARIYVLSCVLKRTSL